jgi:hydrogenase maturation protease
MKQALILGIGNRLMSDDGIGVRIVEALAQDNTMETVRFAAGETDIGYCLSELADADICIIVDAACFGNEPYSVSVLDLEDVLEQKRPARSFHDFDLIHGMKINKMMRKGILITVEVCSVAFSTELSPIMQSRFDDLVRRVKMIIGSYLSDC